MTDKPTSTFARRVRAAKPRSTSYDIRDHVVTGLTLRVLPSGTRTYTVERTVQGRRRYANVGDAATLTVPQARREARKLIAHFTEPAKTRIGPRKPGEPMTAFAEEFFDRQAHRWKPRPRETNARIVRKDILPLLGDMTVDAIKNEQVKEWFASMSKRTGVANRALQVLSTMMWMTERWGYRAHNTNP